MSDPKPGNNEKKSPEMGRTIGDICYELIAKPWSRGLALVPFLIAIVGIVLGAGWCFTKLFDVTTSEVEFSKDNTHVIFGKADTKGGEAIVMVSPQGWQTTGISLKRGDQVEFVAGGKVNIDVTSVLKAVEARQKLEEYWKKKLNIRSNDPTETRVPEDYYTPEQRQSLILDRPWVGPEGFSLDAFKPSFRARLGRYLLPGMPAGGLIAGVKADGVPARDDSQFIGKSGTITAGQDGSLWLTVNDVQNPDSANPDLFYIDNMGSFWVRIKVTHKK